MDLQLKNGKKVRIETSWDDGTHFDLRLHQLLVEYQLPGIFYIPTATRELTDDQIKDIAKTHDIGGHTETHQILRLMPPVAAKEEIEGCKTDLEWITGRDVTSFCYPKGKYNQSIIDMVRKAGYKDARCVDVMTTQLPTDPYRRFTSAHIWQRREYQGVHWMHVARNMFDRVMSADCPADNYFHLWGHSWEIEETDEWENLEKFFIYMKLKLAGYQSIAK